jgi:hypothetical protein
VVYYGEKEDDFVVIPKPFETGMLFGTLPERFMEYLYENDEKELADAIFWMFMETFSMDPTPQAFQPMMDLMRNKNFTGAPIVPEWLEDVEPQEQYRYYTSEAMIALGRKLGVSPLRAEYIVRGYLGTLGTWALGATDYMIKDVGGVDLTGSGEDPATDPWRENVLMSPFVDRGPLRRTKSEDDFYELLQMTQVATKTFKLMSERDPERVLDYLSSKEAEVLINLNSDFGKLATQLRKINNMMQLVRRDQNQSGEEKRAVLDTMQRQKNALVRDVMQQINQKTVRDIATELESNAQ